MKEMKMTTPMLFEKPISSLMASGNVLYLPRENHIEHEIELGVVIGKEGKNIKPDEVSNYVKGYFVGLDITDRDI